MHVWTPGLPQKNRLPSLNEYIGRVSKSLESLPLFHANTLSNQKKNTDTPYNVEFRNLEFRLFEHVLLS